MSFETTTKVVYGDDEVAVNGETFVDIEDKLEAVEKMVGLSEGEKDAAKEWITYSGLMSAGHFVSRPTAPEPTLSKTFSEPEAGLDAIPDYPPYEPAWTQTRILAEREKLLRKEEQLLNRQKAIFARQIQNHESQTGKSQSFNKNNTPYTKTDYINFIIISFILLVVMAACSFIKSS